MKIKLLTHFVGGLVVEGSFTSLPTSASDILKVNFVTRNFVARISNEEPHGQVHVKRKTT